jgi:ABC-type amino acid transport substrate-binding protein
VRRAFLAAAAALLAAVSIVGCGGNAADSDTLRIGTEGTYSPFSYQNSRELHQMGEKPQVVWSAGLRSRAARLWPGWV